MLTQLRLKNWRSIKEATIDFTPITVLIGANSAGKTNIVEALSFIQYALGEKSWQSVGFEMQRRKIPTLGGVEPVELELTYRSRGIQFPLIYQLNATPYGEIPQIAERFAHQLEPKKLYVYMDGSNGRGWYPEGFGVQTPTLLLTAIARSASKVFSDPKTYSDELFSFLTTRIQMLAEGFMPALSLPADYRGDTMLLEPDAHNLVRVLEFMGRTYPDIAQKLYDDLKWMLAHVKETEIRSDDVKAQMVVRETEQAWEAPTISAGTARLTAMLAAHYALEMQDAEQPGLVVIEEPDTALNPGLLRKFVEQIRNYVEGEYPRQFIFTTHNPRFLDYFQPEEVRVVERDEQGLTTVKHIPDHIRKIWLDEYTLGEVWMTRSLGGLPE